MAERLLTTTEAAELLGVTRQTINTWIDNGKLVVPPSPGTHRRIPLSVLSPFLEPGSVPAPASATGAQVVAVTHHAGGVGKTTTTLNLGYALAAAGQRTLLVDLDPQADLSERLGLGPVAPTLGQVLTSGRGTPQVQRCTWAEVAVDLIASNLDDMLEVEMLLTAAQERERRLRRALAALRRDYDFILLDCPPNLTLLTTNALYAADSVLIPVQAHDKAVRQLSKVWGTLDMVREYHPDLGVLGLIVTMADNSTMARQVVAGLRDAYPDQVFSSVIPQRVALRADSRHAAPVALYAADDDSVQAYGALAQEVLDRVQP